MLGFWPQFLLVLIALYFAGNVFSGTLLGRWLLFFPVLMAFVPFVWHVQRTRNLLATLAGLEPFINERFTALTLGLGLVLLAVGVVWAWRYAFSIFVFPLLVLLVYYFGPWAYLKNNLPTEPLLTQTNDISLFAVLGSLCLLAYTLSSIKTWLSRASKDKP
jgi:hypothetical protein